MFYQNIEDENGKVRPESTMSKKLNNNSNNNSLFDFSTYNNYSYNGPDVSYATNKKRDSRPTSSSNYLNQLKNSMLEDKKDKEIQINSMNALNQLSPINKLNHQVLGKMNSIKQSEINSSENEKKNQNSHISQNLLLKNKLSPNITSSDIQIHIDFHSNWLDYETSIEQKNSFYYFNRSIFEMLIFDVYSISERNFNFPYMFNFELFEEVKINKIYARIFKMNLLCYSLTLLINMFVFVDLNLKTNIKKAIQTGSSLNLVFFEMYIKPSLLKEKSDNTSDENKLLLDKHNKSCRSMKLTSETYYFYCKNDCEQLNKLIDSFANLLKLLLQ